MGLTICRALSLGRLCGRFSFIDDPENEPATRTPLLHGIQLEELNSSDPDDFYYYFFLYYSYSYSSLFHVFARFFYSGPLAAFLRGKPPLAERFKLDCS